MAVNTVTSFSPDVGDVVEEAFERAGLEMVSGYDLRSARRSLDLMCIEWANRGINLWTVEELKYTLNPDGSGTQTLVKGTGTYQLRDNTVSVLEVVLRTDDEDTSLQTDYELNRISRETYMGIPSKLTEGRPTQVYIDRQQGKVEAKVWPVPDESSKYKIIYTRVRRMTDSGPGGTYNPDVPDRFWPALVAGLAYNIACKRPEAAARIEMLKANYEQQFTLAAEEDREKAAVRFYPGGYQYS
tara:strand:+ start:2494 stop:3219 length:726 start_codon:yes stop_codon:yes gene_type:complete